MPTADSLLGIVSPFVATIGDVLMTIAVAAFLLLPARLLWRRMTRPVERLAWSLRVAAADGDAPLNRVAAWLNSHWLDWRFAFSVRLRAARQSVATGVLMVRRTGLAMDAFFEDSN